LTERQRAVDLVVYAASGLVLGLGRKTFAHALTSLALFLGWNLSLEELSLLAVGGLVGIGWYFFRDVPEEQGLFRVLVFGLAAAAGRLIVP